MLVLGLLGGAVMWVLSSWLSKDALAIPESLILRSHRDIPTVGGVCSSCRCCYGLRGLLEAYQRFDLVNFTRVPMSVLTSVEYCVCCHSQIGWILLFYRSGGR